MQPGYRRRAHVTVSTLAVLTILAITVACGGSASTGGASMNALPPAAGGTRIVESSSARDVMPAAMLERLARADVVVFGEQHDDRGAHRAQLWLLEALGAGGRPVVLSLEMIERDAQAVLDDYLSGRVSEADFLARSRPWPNYASDYRPLVELARARRWPVIAANVPRPMASAVARRGIVALDSLPPAEREHAARELLCPDDDYRRRFLEQMRSHSPTGVASAADTLPTAMAERFYLAQCVKDETMAESVVGARREAPRGAVVLHVTGSFHAEYGQGVVDRIRRRAPDADIVVLVAVPTSDPAQVSVAPHRGRADYLIFTTRSATSR